MDKTSPILIVDDFPMIRSIVIRLLGESGYVNLKEAEDGSMAWNMLNEAHRSGKDFGLVLLDWNMPRVSGIELIEKCRSIEAFKNLPIIVVTAEREKESVLKALKAGATDFITKPIVESVLLKKTENVFGRPQFKVAS